MAGLTSADRERFAAALVAAMADYGLSVAAMARRVGATRQAVQHWRSAASLPSPAAAALLREALPGLEVPERGVGRPARTSWVLPGVEGVAGYAAPHFSASEQNL